MSRTMAAVRSTSAPIELTAIAAAGTLVFCVATRLDLGLGEEIVAEGSGARTVVAVGTVVLAVTVADGVEVVVEEEFFGVV